MRDAKIFFKYERYGNKTIIYWPFLSQMFNKLFIRIDEYNFSGVLSFHEVFELSNITITIERLIKLFFLLSISLKIDKWLMNSGIK